MVLSFDSNGRGCSENAKSKIKNEKHKIRNDFISPLFLVRSSEAGDRGSEAGGRGELET
jgi:hypothetical protein